MKFILALTLLLCLYQVMEAKPADQGGQKLPPKGDAWGEHKKKYALHLSDDEDKERKGHFLKADAIIKKHNAEGHKSKLAHNHLSHMSEAEKKQLRGAIPPTQSRFAEISERSDTAVADTLDWRNVNGKDYLAPIQNQGQCGSCWTFSATASLESRWAIKYGYVPKLSEQNIVDCCHTGNSDQSGCNGGWYNNAWDYVASSKGHAVGEITGTNQNALPKPYPGQDYLSGYPYTAKPGTCAFTGNYGAYTWPYSTPNSYYKKSASHNIKANSPAAFKAALQSGPISVAIDASGSTFSYYKSGTIEASQCGTTIDHAVNVIGYGSDSNGKYWLMRNSWGTGWGENGYMKFERTDEEGSLGTCGVLQYGAYPNMLWTKN